MSSRPPDFVEISDRGFQHLTPILGAYGGHVRVYESSAAIGPHIWLQAKESEEQGESVRPGAVATIHLSLDSAKLLRDQLTYLIDNHYQVREW